MRSSSRVAQVGQAPLQVGHGRHDGEVAEPGGETGRAPPPGWPRPAGPPGRAAGGSPPRRPRGRRFRRRRRCRPRRRRASMSRGTARSRKNIGRPRRCRIAASTSGRAPRRASGSRSLPTTTSACCERLRQRRSQVTARAADPAPRAPRPARACGWRSGGRATPGLDGLLARRACPSRPPRGRGRVRSDDLPEDLRRELEPDRRDRERVLRDLRLRADALAGGERALEEPVEHGPGRPASRARPQRRRAPAPGPRSPRAPSSRAPRPRGRGGARPPAPPR